MSAPVAEAIGATVPAVPTVARRPVNRLLGALPSVDYDRLARDLVYCDVAPRQILQRHGRAIEKVFFPERGIWSIMQTMDDGGGVEIAMIGEEGMIGIGAVLGSASAFGDVVARTTGAMFTLDAVVFERELDRRGAFHGIMTRYCQRFIGLATQSAACNGLHSARQRIGRWLLASSDRLHTDELLLTHELLAMMLGVRRPTVTLLLEELAKEGIIWQHRGKVRIVNRPGLAKVSCECYAHEKGLFD